MKDRMTLDEFERRYAEHTGISLIELYSWGFHGEPCDCGQSFCQGWRATGPWERRGPRPADAEGT